MDRLNNFSGWVKHFADGSRLLGDDKSVDKSLVSWRRSSGREVIEGAVAHKYSDVTLFGEIRGPGVYWQSDDLIAPMVRNSNVTGTRTVRRIEKQISPDDKFLKFSHTPTFLIVSTIQDLSLPLARTVPLPVDSIGSWLVVEIDIQAKSLSWRISKERI